MEDHEYVFTIVGLCGHKNCGKARDVHPVFKKSKAREPGVCVVDHLSIVTVQKIGDEGLEWAKCPACLTYIEPKMRLGVLRSKGGRGRMPFTQRHLNELSRMKAAFEGGYYKS